MASNQSSNQSESGTANGQVGTASEYEEAQASGGEFEAAAEASQTLPLITEELAATHAGEHQCPPAITSHVSTPVIPPNPIRRENVPESSTRLIQESTAVSGASAPVSTGPNDGEANGSPEKKEKSEGRVSATQLLAGAAAAATSSVIGGQLGVAGTVVGAGVASIITGLAVTLYTNSLDKGKEKIKEVGSKLAPAVKAKSLGARTQRSVAVAAGQTESTFGSISDKSADAAADGQATTVGGETKSRWQKLRRRRVLYPVAIAVATFGIGLGAVVMAETFTDADISPGTSQISRSVSGESGAGDDSGTGEETGTSQDGGSSFGTDSSGPGSQPGQNPNQGSGVENATTAEGQSTSASEGSVDSSASTDEVGTDQSGDTSGSESTAESSADSSGTSSTGADTTGGTGSSDGSGGSSNSGSQGADGSSGGGSGSGGSDGGSGSEGQGSTTAAQG